MCPAVDYSRLAEFYDLLVDFSEDIPFFLAECERAAGEILELMSGTGRVSVPLIATGFDLTCVDSSPEMLARLRGKLDSQQLSAILLEQDVRKLELPRQYDLVIWPFNSFEELDSDEDRVDTMRLVRRALRDRGRLVVTCHNPAVRLRELAAGRSELTRRLERGDRLELEVFQQAQGDRVSGKETIRLRAADGTLCWLLELGLHYRLISEREFRGLAEATGFVVEDVLGNYDRVPLEPTSPFMIWLLRKGPD